MTEIYTINLTESFIDVYRWTFDLYSNRTRHNHLTRHSHTSHRYSHSRRTSHRNCPHIGHSHRTSY